jgi:fumarylacetoacetase
VTRHLPYGSLLDPHGRRFAAARLGDQAIDLSALTAVGPFAGLFEDGSLDAFLAAGRPVWSAVRQLLIEMATASQPSSMAGVLRPLAESVPVLPFTVADYVDFYASEQHATNVGRIFRPDADPLTPNWKHLPIGYHGRAGTVVVSGTDVIRPCGQARTADGDIRFGPSQRLDIEAEVGFVVGTGTRLGRRAPVAAFRDHVFGICLLNDWSARDIQAWEYVPLGPFLGKSFATSVSAWITPLDALDGAWTTPPHRDPPVLPYLADSPTPAALDLTLEISLNGTVISRPPFASMYWTPAQMLAHLTVNGASLRPGDLFASGTVSGAEQEQWGSLLELSWNGANPLKLSDGSTRTFLENGDEVVLRATTATSHGPVEIGEVRGRVLPAEDPDRTGPEAIHR